jgi:hypothetical protein
MRRLEFPGLGVGALAGWLLPQADAARATVARRAAAGMTFIA